jgi:hypothetical protein
MDYSSLPDRPGNPEEEVYGGVAPEETPGGASVMSKSKGGDGDKMFFEFVSCFIW